MTDAFDPYYIWLGIPPEEQPPHHYRLLGVTLFEENSEVIEAAANRQMAYMQEISAGDDHIDQAQRILGELSKARVCLLSDEKKNAYNAKLRASFEKLNQASDSTPTSSPSAPTTPAPKQSRGNGSLMPPQLGKRKTQVPVRPGFLAGISLLIIGAIISWLFLRTPKDGSKVSQNGEPTQAEQQAIQQLDKARRRAEEAEQQLKEEKKRAADTAARKEAQEEKKKAAEEAEAKRKFAEEKKKAAEQAEAKRKAEELRNNPEKLLESRGFEQKGKKWVFVKAQKLKLATKKLVANWKLWQKNRPKTDAEIKTKLEAYNKLLLLSFENSAMRLAVREDLTGVLEDPEVTAALVKLNVKGTELNKLVKALQRPDSKLRKAIPNNRPIIPGEKAGHFYAALIIAEKESAIVQLHPGDMGKRDSPNLFILPRAKWDAAGGKLGKPKNVMFNDGWGGPVLETSGLPIRCGLNRASNPTVHLPLTQSEGGTGTDIDFLGGKSGANAWKIFFSQMKPYKIDPSMGAIEQARQNLDAYEPEQKK